LADRYASKAMQGVFSSNKKYGFWRRLWTYLAEAQYEQGLEAIKPEMHAEMTAHWNDVDLQRAGEIEKLTKHDVMAHIRHFGEQCPKAKPIIHLGATSMEVGDNTDLKEMREALELVRDKTVKCIHLAGVQAEKHRDLMCLGYTHIQPAEPVTMGRRMAQWGYDLSLALGDIEYRLERFTGRGAKGTTGTQASFLKLFNGDAEKVRKMDEAFTTKAGFRRIFLLTGQTYPRVYDHQIISALSNLAIPVYKTGEDICLLQSFGELEEPFEKTQVGSTAMAFKRNPKNTERMKALARYLIGKEEGMAHTAAVQKFERTLDDSAFRRIEIPDSFYAADAMLELYMLVMDGLVVYPKIVSRRLDSLLPFMATESILMEAVKKGGDRQTIHEKIRGHSMDAAQRVRDGMENDLLKRIANDEGIPMSQAEINEIMLKRSDFYGLAPQQVDLFLAEVVEPLRKKYHKALELKSSVEI
jgi:adenylosuccinate lyase